MTGEAKSEEVGNLKYHCNECGKDFETHGNKKGTTSKEVTHCGKPAHYRGTVK